MATQILFLSFLILFTVSPSHVISTRSEKEIKLLFEGWLVKHHKNYNSLFEKEKRYNIFKDKLKFIDEHNAAGNHSITLGLTVFADLTNDEYRKTYLGFRQPTGSKTSSEESTNGYYHFNEISESLPDSIDWRLQNAVTPVKINARCNVSPFSAIAAVEGLNAIDTGSLISLSEQEIMDCSGKGCMSDGSIEDAFKFIISNGGIDTDEDYPNENHDNECDTIKLGRRVVSIDGYRNIPPNNELYLKKVVANQPVSVMIDINGVNFESYESGIFDEPCDHTELNYAVAVVGYGSEDGKDYWLIKNSWGEDWGENGYMRLRRNIDQPQGKCGITLAASYPVKSSLQMNIDDQNPIEEKASTGTDLCNLMLMKAKEQVHKNEVVN